MSIQDLSLKTVIHSKVQHSFYCYTVVHPMQCKSSGCSPINETIFAVSNGLYEIDVLAHLLRMYVGIKKMHYFYFCPTLTIY